MSFEPVGDLRVSLGTRAVGRLARVDRRLLFEFDPTFLADPLPLSPAHLPVRPGVLVESTGTFDGLFGVFDDSLPDGWGRLLLDREMDRRGVGRHALGPLDRLAFVGENGPGALTYRPAWTTARPAVIDLSQLAREARQVLEGTSDEVFPELLAMGGSSGGARPKVLLDIRPTDGAVSVGRDAPADGFVPAIVKFGSSGDPPDVGPVELAYSRMARAAGVEVAPTWLLDGGSDHPGFFATARFDRPRVHIHSLCGLLHASHRVPSLDYEAVLRTVRWLTRDQRAVDQMFSRMAFNVLAHNRDDHSKNFAFRMTDAGEWGLAPAFDLVFAAGPGGEHWLTVAGEGRSPTIAHMVEVARRVGVARAEAALRIDRARAAVDGWSIVAREAGVSGPTRRRIGAVLGGARA